jgi:1-deoxy-D-xylulose-5-phosphate synthase
MPEWKTPFKKLEIGKGQKIKGGKELAIISIGHVGNYAIEATNILAEEKIEIGHFDIRFLKPIDEELLHEVFKQYKKVITLEDGTITGGLGSAVIEFMNDHNYSAQIKRMGIPDAFIGHGSPEQLYKDCGFDVDGVVMAVKGLLSKSIPK